MKVIVCGDKNVNDYHLVKFAIVRSGISHKISEVISVGDNKVHKDNSYGGVAYNAQVWARVNNRKVTRQPAKEARYGRCADIVRNVHTIRQNEPDHLIAIWDGNDVIVKHMIKICKNYGVPVFEFILAK